MYAHYRPFLRPTLEGKDRPSLRTICQQYDIDSEATVSNMLNTVKKLFRSVLKNHVRQTVVSGDVAEEEFKEIFKFLEKEGKN